MKILHLFIKEVIKEISSTSTTGPTQIGTTHTTTSYGSKQSRAKQTKLKQQQLKQQEKLPDTDKVDNMNADDWSRFMRQNDDIPVVNYMHSIAADDTDKVPSKWKELEHDDSDDFAWKMLAYLKRNKRF